MKTAKNVIDGVTPKLSPSELPPSGISPRWWVASGLFHVVLIGWLVMFSPVRVFDPNAKPETSHVSPARAREVMNQIREKQAGSLEQNLRTLSDIQGKIATLESSKRAEFTTFAREMAKNAPTKAVTELQTISELQEKVLAELDQASENAANFVDTHASAYFDDLVDAQRAASEGQVQLTQMQEQAQGVLSLGDDRLAAVRSAHNVACAAQERANKALIVAEEGRDQARSTRRRTDREGQIEHYTYHLRRTKEQLTKKDANLQILKKTVAASEIVAAEAKTVAEEATAKAAADPSEHLQLAVKMAQQHLERVEYDLASAQRELSDYPKTLEDAEKQLPVLTAKVAELLASPEPNPVATTDDEHKFIALLATARELQKEAQLAQQKALLLASSIQQKTNTDADNSAGAAALATLDAATISEAVTPLANPEQMNIAQIYQSAVKIEGVLTQSYRRLRATELAMIRRLPLEKAIELTEVANAVRPDLQAALLATVESGEDLQQGREAVQTAKAEIAAMVRLATSLLSQAQGFDKSEGSTIDAEDYDAKFAQWEKMQMLAAEEDGEWAKDLSYDMQNGEGGNGEGGNGGGGNGGGGKGGGGKGGNGNSGQAGSGSNPGLGASGIAGPFGQGGFGRGGIPGARGAAAAPEDISSRVRPAPGRRVASRGSSQKWFFADSWYIIGPFDNTRRGNIERKFQPETVIDLNAKYTGKHGIPIEWEFHQSSKPNIMPPLDAYNDAMQNPAISIQANYMRNLQYIIYYAYTELWFEEACDLWVAIGSDDFSKVWIEDQLVWSSGKSLKAWKINEGLRKVHFKAGINRVLYRVENGNDKTEFSLVVSLQP